VILAQATGTRTILRLNSESIKYNRVIQSPSAARDAALFWDGGPSPQGSAISLHMRSMFALRAGS
jgi:hypothetical protein